MRSHIMMRSSSLDVAPHSSICIPRITAIDIACEWTDTSEGIPANHIDGKIEGPIPPDTADYIGDNSQVIARLDHLIATLPKQLGVADCIGSKVEGPFNPDYFINTLPKQLAVADCIGMKVESPCQPASEPEIDGPGNPQESQRCCSARRWVP